MMTGLQMIGVDITWRHLGHGNGICDNRFSLTILISGSIHFQLRWTCPLTVIIHKETYKQLYRFVTFELNGRSLCASNISVEDECLKALQFRSQRINALCTLLKKKCTLLQSRRIFWRNQANLGRTNSNKINIGVFCLRRLELSDISLQGCQFLFIDRKHIGPRLEVPIVTTYRNTALGRLHGVRIEVSFRGYGSQFAPGLHTHFKQGNSSLQIFHILTPFIIKHLLGG